MGANLSSGYRKEVPDVQSHNHTDHIRREIVACVLINISNKSCCRSVCTGTGDERIVSVCVCVCLRICAQRSR